MAGRWRRQSFVNLRENHHGQRKHTEKLSRVRPPRVQITYDVEIGDAIETKELPFVLGVLGITPATARSRCPR